MAILSFLNPLVYVDGLAVSAVSNQCDVNYSAQELDVTTFGSSGTRQRIAGLTDTKITVSGFADYTATTPAYEQTLQALLGALPTVALLPAGRTVGGTAYLASMVGGMYTMGGKIGDAPPFSLDMTGNSKLTRSTILGSDDGTTAVLVTGTGAITNVGAVSSSQSVYAHLHVVAVAGTASPTLTVIIQSAAAVGFASPTTRASFTARTTVGAQRIVVAGPITDAYWRTSITVSGTNPKFEYACAMGIQ